MASLSWGSWVGLDGVKHKLQDMAQLKKAQQLVAYHGAELQRKAQLYAPVDTGNLRRSITLKIEPKVATVKATAEYAPYVEYGTRFMAAQPYMRVAYYDERELYARDMSKIFEE